MNDTHPAQDALASWQKYCKEASYDEHYNDLMRVEPAITNALQSASREWMPVSEYDASMGDVLVFGKLDSGESYIDRSSVWVSDTALNGRWTITFMYGFLPPTHFQYLPTPPKQGA